MLRSPSRCCTAWREEQRSHPQRLNTKAQLQEVWCSDCDLLLSVTNPFLAYAQIMLCRYHVNTRLLYYDRVYVNAKILVVAYWRGHISYFLHSI
jgi:hypothetical protein